MIFNPGRLGKELEAAADPANCSTTAADLADVLAEVPPEEPDAPGYSVHRSPCPYEHGGACTCS